MFGGGRQDLICPSHNAAGKWVELLQGVEGKERFCPPSLESRETRRRETVYSKFKGGATSSKRRKSTFCPSLVVREFRGVGGVIPRQRYFETGTTYSIYMTHLGADSTSVCEKIRQSFAAVICFCRNRRCFFVCLKADVLLRLLNAR